MTEQNTTAKSVNIKRYYKDTVGELKKVVWPTRSQLANSTVAVIGAVIVVGIFIWIFDAGLNILITRLLGVQ